MHLGHESISIAPENPRYWDLSGISPVLFIGEENEAQFVVPYIFTT